VTFRLTTKAAGGLTFRDMGMAVEIEKLAATVAAT
jgi:pterin-4a-carbinolamine dehydratase